MRQFVKSCFLLALFAAFVTSTEAQGVNLNDSNASAAGRRLPVKRAKRPKPISKEWSAGLRLNTNGWSLFFNKGYVMSEERYSDLFYNIRLFQLEISEIKHTKELKRTNNSLNGNIDAAPTPFIFAKANNFYPVKIGYGFRKMIAGKPEHGNISVHWVYMGGISIGILKPYYIKYGDNTGGFFTEETITYTDSTRIKFLDKPNIIGGAGFSQGFSELSIIPGIHAKTALHFDFASEKRSKMAVETGFEFQYYTKNIELLAEVDPKSYFISFYTSIEFGKRK